MADYKLTFNVPEEYTGRLLEALADLFNWDKYVEDNGGNPPLNKPAFVKSMIARWMRRAVHDYERRQAQLAIVIDEIVVTEE